MPSGVHGGSFGHVVLSSIFGRPSRTDRVWRSCVRAAADSRSDRSKERPIQMWSPRSARCVTPYEKAGSESSPGPGDGGVLDTEISESFARSLPRTRTGISMPRRGADCQERGVVTGMRMR